MVVEAFDAISRAREGGATWAEIAEAMGRHGMRTRQRTMVTEKDLRTAWGRERRRQVAKDSAPTPAGNELPPPLTQATLVAPAGVTVMVNAGGQGALSLEGGRVAVNKGGDQKATVKGGGAEGFQVRGTLDGVPVVGVAAGVGCGQGGGGKKGRREFVAEVGVGEVVLPDGTRLVKVRARGVDRRVPRGFCYHLQRNQFLGDDGLVRQGVYERGREEPTIDVLTAPKEINGMMIRGLVSPMNAGIMPPVVLALLADLRRETGYVEEDEE